MRKRRVKVDGVEFPTTVVCAQPVHGRKPPRLKPTREDDEMMARTLKKMERERRERMAKGWKPRPKDPDRFRRPIDD